MPHDKTEELIKTIAVKHGIAVGRNDPILVLQTINAQLMADSATAQQEILNQFRDELESVAQGWENDAKNKAERIINTALSASREAMTKSMHDGANIVTESVRSELATTIQKFSEQIRESKRVAFLNLTAAALTFFAAGLVLWASK